MRRYQYEDKEPIDPREAWTALRIGNISGDVELLSETPTGPVLVYLYDVLVRFRQDDWWYGVGLHTIVVEGGVAIAYLDSEDEDSYGD